MKRKIQWNLNQISGGKEAGPRLFEELERLADSHARLERERGSVVGTLTANARALLRSLGEE